MKLTAGTLWQITKDTFIKFTDDNPFNHSAIISYYTIFSLPALLILVMRIAGIFLGDDAVSGQLFGEISGLVGAKTAADIQGMVKAASKTQDSWWASILGILTLAFSATTVFVALQESINAIWGVKAKPEKGWLKYIINRLLSISVVGGVAFLLLVSLAAAAFISVINTYIKQYFSEFALYLAYAINIFVSLGLITCLFAIIFKVLPDAKIKWSNTWVGAFITTLLFVLGKELIGLYIGFSGADSAYGAAGSVVLVMVWVYYSALILLLGAEFTKIYALAAGNEIAPAENAVKVEIKEVHINADGEVEKIKEVKAEEKAEEKPATAADKAGETPAAAACKA